MTIRTFDKTEKNERLIFAPGCVLMLYKPALADKIHSALCAEAGRMDWLLTCCHYDPGTDTPLTVIIVCPGCDKRFGCDYREVSTISLWEILVVSESFPFPDYHGRRMSIMDACPTRNRGAVQTAIRTLLQRMNIALEEPRNTRAKSICCGDSFYGTVPTVKVKELMMKRTSEMPVEEVVVYCVSCIKSVHIGGKKTRYLPDLLFDERTDPQTFDPDDWHRQLDAYMNAHQPEAIDPR